VKSDFYMGGISMRGNNVVKEELNGSAGVKTITSNTFDVDMKDLKVVVIVPAYNEERFIGSVVLKLRQFPVKIIVVDDGSTDDTAALAKAAGARVFSLSSNQGKGAALNFGFHQARIYHPDVVVLIDADGQHLPEELPGVICPILKGEADIVVGSRYINNSSNTPLDRRLGHKLISFLTALSTGVDVSDSQNGYRAFSRKAYEQIRFCSSDFSVESEMQFLANEFDLKIKEVPITIRYLDKQKRPAIKQGMIVLGGILKLASQYRPLLFFGGSGLISLSIGLIWGLVVVTRFMQSGLLAVGYALICVLLCVIGLVLFSTGITLHTTRSLMLDLFNRQKSG